MIAHEVIDDVVARRGPAAIIGRYHTSKPLDTDFKVQRKVLGRGCSGTVLLAKDARGKPFAVKTLQKDASWYQSDALDRQFAQNEINIHLTLDHPHVAKLEHVYETERNLQLVIEHMAGGDLYMRLARKGRFTEEEAAACISQILLGVSYLHARGVVHRDLKMENVMYKDRACNHVKLIDVGMATRWDGVTPLTHACGTPLCLAPEVWRRSYTDKVDVWAVGLMAFELLTGQAPFPSNRLRGCSAKSEKQRLNNVRNGRVAYRESFFRLSNEAQHFVRSLLSVDVASRPSAAMALEHPWLRNFRSADKEPELPMLRSFKELAQASSCRRACLSMIAGELSLEEQMDLQKAFHAIDKERSGSIQLHDFCVAMQHIGMEEADARETFLKLIGDEQASEIGYSEFLAAGLHSGMVYNNEACRAAFQRFDEHKIGAITALDHTLSISTTASGIDALIQEADMNSDGEVSFDEFVSYLQLQRNPKGCGSSLNPISESAWFANGQGCWSWLSVLSNSLFSERSPPATAV